MGISRIQTAQNSAGSGGAVAVAFSSPVTAGNLLIAIFAGLSTNGVNIPTDTQGNTWTLAVADLAPESPSSAIYYAVASVTGPCAVTGTITLDLSSNAINGIVAEYAGFTGVSIDITNTASAASGTSIAMSTAFPVLQAAEVIVAYGYDSPDTPVAWTADGGFSIVQMSDNAVSGSLSYADQIISAINTYGTTFAGTGIVSGSFLAAGIAAFQGTLIAGPTKLAISLMGTKRYGKAREPVCTEARQPKPVKLFETE